MSTNFRLIVTVLSYSRVRLPSLQTAASWPQVVIVFSVQITLTSQFWTGDFLYFARKDLTPPVIKAKLLGILCAGARKVMVKGLSGSLYRRGKGA